MKNKINPPAVLSAHDLRNGNVVYWSGKSWLVDIKSAQIAQNDEEVIVLQEIAAKDLAKNLIVDVEIFPVEINAKGVFSKTLRESFLISGPTIEYGKVQGAQ